MSSVSEAVQAAVESDVFLREALARGIVNHQALAVWLQVHRGIEGTVDAIAKAARRYEGAPVNDLQDAAWKALSGATVHGKAAVCAVIVRRSRELRKPLSELWDTIETSGENRIRLITTRGIMVIIAPAAKRQAVIDVIGAENIVSVEDDLIEFALEPTGRDIPGAAMLGLVLSALTARGVTVHYAMNGAIQQLVVVPASADGEVFEILAQMAIAATRDDPAE